MSVLKNELKNVTPSEVAMLRKYFSGFDYRGAGYTFVANYIWRTTYCVSWEIIEGYLCLAGSKCDKEDAVAFMSMPMVVRPEDVEEIEKEYGIRARCEYEPESLKRAVLECYGRFSGASREFYFTNIPGHMRGYLEEAFGSVDGAGGAGDASGGGIEFIHEPDYDEYVYLKEKLITLSGRALHKKKNHLNFFLRNYEYEARPITEENKKDVLALAAEIRDFKAQDEDEVEDIENEYEAIEAILGLMEGRAADRNIVCRDECPIYGVAIYIKGKLEAFAIGETITETLAAEHFEKANDSFRGLYQLVCSEFCKLLPESIEFVNREEDMGLPNLRQAKEALKPHHMEERYTAKFQIFYKKSENLQSS